VAGSVKEAFTRLHEKGLIYRGTYMVNWSPNLQTAVSDLEVEYADEEGSLYFFKYPVEGEDGAFLPVATTRPETILGDTAVAVNPNDERCAHLLPSPAPSGGAHCAGAPHCAGSPTACCCGLLWEVQQPHQTGAAGSGVLSPELGVGYVLGSKMVDDPLFLRSEVAPSSLFLLHPCLRKLVQNTG
jgi:hypothetical protein